MVLLLNSQGLEQTETDSETIVTTPFMKTSTDGYLVTEENQAQGQYIVGAVATNTVNTDGDEDTETETLEARLTVLASGSLIDSNITDQLTTLDNLTLFVNSVTENFDDVDNVAIEAKSLGTERNTPLHASAFSLLVIFVIPAAILLIGFVLWWRRRKA